MGEFVKQMRFEVSRYQRLGTSGRATWLPCPLIVQYRFAGAEGEPKPTFVGLTAAWADLDTQTSKLLSGCLLFGSEDSEKPAADARNPAGHLQWTQLSGRSDASSVANYLSEHIARPTAVRHNLAFVGCSVAFGVLEGAAVCGSEPAVAVDPVLLQDAQKPAGRRGLF